MAFFNAIIESVDLRELALSRGQFTWANRRELPTYEKLDRILVSTEWEQKNLLLTVQALSRSGSDHTPLLLDSEEQSHISYSKNCSFELSSLKRDGFIDIVTQEWNLVPHDKNPIVNWKNKFIICVTFYLLGSGSKWKIQD
jgi:hypothetical protein